MVKYVGNKNVLRDLVITGSDKEYGKQTVKGILR